MPVQLRLGEWLPDLPAIDNPGALEAKNVVPNALSYRPFKSFAAATSALTARCQGAFTCRDLAGSNHTFAGDATKLYKLDAEGDGWADVSRTVGGAYAVDTANGWSFCQFGNIVVATNGTDVPQAYTLGTSTDFDALAGSPPTGRFVATVDPAFVVIGRVTSLFNEVRWSQFGDPAGSWTVSASTQADLQDLPDGGFVMGIVGGLAGTIFQRNAIRRMFYVGSDLVFDITKVSTSIGCMAENSIAAFQNDSFFLSDNGFYQLSGGQQLLPIGENKINRTFLADLDFAYLHRVVGTIDPQNSLYVVIYPGAGNAGGTPNKGLIYHWPTQRWSRFELDLEFVYPGQSATSFTLDTLDTPMPSIDGAPQISFDSPLWAGSGRLALAGFDTSHQQGFFTGADLEAIIDTQEVALTPGQRTMIRSARPIFDGSGTASITPITRNLPNETPQTGAAVAANVHGVCPLRTNARYTRGRLKIASGGSVNHITGIDDIEMSKAGMR